MVKIFPEIHQVGAPSEISAIYTDIRTVSGVPTVNLIWRHLATIPGALLWAWTAVRPLVCSQEMVQARNRLINAVLLPVILPLSTSALKAAGMNANSLKIFTGILEDYIRGNCTNIIALTALRLKLEGVDAASQVLSPSALEPTRTVLPPLAKIESLPINLAEKIRGLAMLHDGSDGSIIPSLYLELARWPNVVDAFPEWLNELYKPVNMRASRDSTCLAAEIEARKILPTIDPPPGKLEEILPALEHFTRLIIPDLIPVCLATQRLISPPQPFK